MSDSEADVPSDKLIEQSLHRIVREAISKEEDITINLARARAEKDLGLEESFFKDSIAWKARSKEIINRAVEASASPERPKKTAPAKAGAKRKSEEKQPVRKRIKKSDGILSHDVVEQSDDSNAEETRVTKEITPTGENHSDAEHAVGKPASETPNGHNEAAAEDDSSDLSSVIDDPKPKQKRQKKPVPSTSTKTRTKPEQTSKDESSVGDVKLNSSRPAAKNGSKTATSLSPDEEEIKRLQSQLLKCGVRKLWHRELSGYSTAKAKISRLRIMLEDVGMTGRFSAEKAKQIKEQRELDAELEAAKEFNEKWGDGDEQDEDEPRGETEVVAQQRRPKGLVDLGDSDDGDDSD